jgi:acetylornithine deacetylase/succinyl-diaminopimelate desuccinylase family protein
LGALPIHNGGDAWMRTGLAIREAIIETIDAAAGEIVEFASELIAFPTENPPGSAYEACSSHIAERLARLGSSVEVLELAPGRKVVLAGAGEGKTIYLHGHYDVVPASAKGQFDARVSGGRLWGRGSADMKGAVAAMAFALAAVARTELDGRVEIVLVPDEESGGRLGSELLLKSGRLGRNGIAAILGEPTGGTIWNAHRGALTLRITLRGTPAHVGLQHNGRNAFEAAIPLLHELHRLKIAVEAERTDWPTENEDAQRSILMLGGEVHGGHQFNVVPDRFSFTIERRFNPEEHLEEVKAELYRLIEANVERRPDVDVFVIQQAMSSGVKADSDLVKTLSRAAESVTGRSPVCRLCPGLLESRFYSEAGVPVVAYGPGELEVSHGPTESVDIARLIEDSKVYALTAAGLLGAW